MYSVIDLVREVPAELVLLPPEALKKLSATCRSLRTSFCARAKVISLSAPADASKLCCTTWSQLRMVRGFRLELTDKLSAQWEWLLEMRMLDAIAEDSTVVLLRPREQLHSPFSGVSLPMFVEQQRRSTECIILRIANPCVVCQVVQAFTQDRWPRLEDLILVKSPQLGLQSMLHLIGSLPSLESFTAADCVLDATVLSTLSVTCNALYLRNVSWMPMPSQL